MPRDMAAEYRQCIYDIWIASKFARTFADDLMGVMFDHGFLIDNVTVSYSWDEHIIWKGTCYDADLSDYVFNATWTMNMTKFSASDVHYYELTDLDIEPKGVWQCQKSTSTIVSDDSKEHSVGANKKKSSPSTKTKDGQTPHRPSLRWV